MNALSLSNRHRHPLANGHLPEMDQLLDRVFSGFEFSPSTASRWPDVHVESAGDEYRVSVDLPGVEQQDVELSFHDGTLSVKAQRKTAQTNARYSARWSGSFERFVELGEDVDADRIKATLKNGVLTVTLPKKPEHQPRRIQIE